MQVAVTDRDYDQRIGILQQQIMALHAQKKKLVFDGIEINTKACGGPRKKTATETDAAVSPDQETPTDPKAAEPVINSTIPAETSGIAAVIPPSAHPFSEARDANYLPPKDRNYGAAPPVKGRDPAYHSQAPIQDPKIADEVYKRSIKNGTITLSHEELLALS